MNSPAQHKVQAEHLSRKAFLYVRQSTLRQVQENRESTQRQYGLRDRALALGWTVDQVVVIDCDQGQSGSSALEREGFQRLVAEVSMNRAGIVMGLEVSRLARNSSDWHRLLEICALTRTLLLDDDGLYDPCHFNDRLLLGLKGGGLRTLELPLPLPFCVLSRTRPEVIEEIDRLLGTHPYERIVEILNAKGLRSGDNRTFNVSIVGRICKNSGLKSRHQRLREAGMLTRKEMARRLKVSDLNVTPWRRKGWIVGHRSNYKTEHLYEPPSSELIAELKKRRRHEHEKE